MKPSDYPSSNATPPSLLLRIRETNDLDAWRTFEEIYTPIIRLYCGHRGLQAADIDDIVQEVMASVARSIAKFEYQPQKGRFRNWLGVITRNQINGLLGSRAMQNMLWPGGSLDHVEIAINDSDWVTIFSEHIFRVACERVRPHFESQTWDCFQASWVEQCSASEIAERLAIPIHTVYVNKSRVLKRLEKEVRLLADDYPIEMSELD